MNAVTHGTVGAARLLIQHGESVYSVASSGETALHLAAKESHPESCLLLLIAGSIVDATDSHGITRCI